MKNIFHFKFAIIGKYILPLFDPIAEYLEPYGIAETTVYAIPAILLLIMSLLRTKKNTAGFKVYLLYIPVSEGHESSKIDPVVHEKRPTLPKK
jgi:hypothetical protein